MKTIAIVNYKGGVGKTVTTVNLAAELSAMGKRVIVMDADGQRNLSRFYKADTESGDTTYELMTGTSSACWDEIIQPTDDDCSICIVPASAELPKADLAALDDGEKYGAVLRAKGIVKGEGCWIHFDYVPGESDIREGGAMVTGRICVIGSKLNEEAVAKLFGVEKQ